MIPILYERSEVDFTTNGVGRLKDCIKCTVTEERNGTYECVFKYPITGIHYADIKEGMIVACTHDNTGDIQPFDIYRRTVPIDGIVTFYAHHISYRLLNVILQPFTADGIVAALAAFKSNSVNENPFGFWTDKTTQGTYTIRQPSSLREMLGGTQGSILDVYGTGDYEFDRFNVRLWADRGNDNGVTIRYGKNLVDLETDYDTSGTYNAVAPYWVNDESGALVMLPEVMVLSPSALNTNHEYWTDEDLNFIIDENGNRFEFDYATIKAVPLDLSSDFDSEPTEEQLREKAIAKMESGRHWLPTSNVKVDFAALWQTPEYADVAPLQSVSLCDTVRVVFADADVDVKEKVIKTTYNVLTNTYDEIELGNPKTSLADVITNQVETQLEKDFPTKGFLAESLNAATKLITGGLGGHVVFNMNANGEPQEILIMDTDSIETAVNVIRLNKNGIGFSNNGYEGPFTSAWTIDNVLDMSQINVTNLSANDIKAGTIRSEDGGNTWNLETGTFQTKSGTSITRIDGGRISFLLDNDGSEGQTASIRPIAWGNDFETGRGVMFATQSGAVYMALAHQSGNGYAADLIINNGLNPDGNTERVQLLGSTLFQGDSRVTGALSVDSNCVFDGTLTVRSYCYFNRQIHIYTGLELVTGGDGKQNAYVNVQTAGLGFGEGTLLLKTYNKDGLVYVGHLIGFADTIYNRATAYNIKMYVDGNVMSEGDIMPYNDGISKCGNVNKRWYQVWSTSFNFVSTVYINYNATNDYIYSSRSIHQASDENLKIIRPYTDNYDAFLDDLEPIIYKWKARPDSLDHVGLGARKTAEILKKHDLSGSGFVGVNVDEDGKETYSIDYQELSVMLLHAYQKQKAEVEELKKETAELKAQMQRILEKLEG